MSKKEHVGYERLQDWVRKQLPWMQKIIQEVIEAQNSLSDEKIEKMCQLLIDKKKIVEDATLDSQIIIKKESSQEVAILKSLEHMQGVNKIKEGGKIDFHKRMTICFGENASGKTGYVRIIKKIAQSLTQKPILSDINKEKETHLLPNFKVYFYINGKEVEWKKITKYFITLFQIK